MLIHNDSATLANISQEVLLPWENFAKMLFELAQRSFFLFCKFNKKINLFSQKQETFLEVSSISSKTFHDKPIMLKQPCRRREP